LFAERVMPSLKGDKGSMGSPPASIFARASAFDMLCVILAGQHNDQAFLEKAQQRRASR
jgi:hypothetical protein